MHTVTCSLLALLLGASKAGDIRGTVAILWASEGETPAAIAVPFEAPVERLTGFALGFRAR